MLSDRELQAYGADALLHWLQLASHPRVKYRDLLCLYVGLQLALTVEHLRNDPGDAQKPLVLSDYRSLRDGLFRRGPLLYRSGLQHSDLAE